jgi:hypothetical protein
MVKLKNLVKYADKKSLMNLYNGESYFGPWRPTTAKYYDNMTQFWPETPIMQKSAQKPIMLAHMYVKS